MEEPNNNESSGAIKTLNPALDCIILKLQINHYDNRWYRTGLMNGKYQSQSPCSHKDNTKKFTNEVLTIKIL